MRKKICTAVDKENRGKFVITFNRVTSRFSLICNLSIFVCLRDTLRHALNHTGIGGGYMHPPPPPTTTIFFVSPGCGHIWVITGLFFENFL